MKRRQLTSEMLLGSPQFLSKLIQFYSEYQGKLPAFTVLGGYTLRYVCPSGDVLCASCASEAIETFLTDEDCYDNDPPFDYETYDDGPSDFCANCNTEIESSYGDPAACEECGETDCVCVQSDVAP